MKHASSLLLCAGSTLLVLIGAELALRALDLPKAYRIPRPDDEYARALTHEKSSIPGLAYELRRTGDLPGSTNPLGIRDTVDILDKPRGTRRIVCLGDSFTYGLGVGVTECYAKRLEHHLGGVPRGWQVLNLGVGGYCSRDEACVFLHKIPLFDPDLVIVGYALNDPDTENTGGLHNFFRHHPASHRLHLFRLGKGALRRIGKWRWGGYIPYMHRDEHYWGSVREAFRVMGDCAARRELPVLLVIFPVPPRGDRDCWQSYPYEWVHEQVRDEGLKNAFDVIDLLPVFRAHSGDSLRLSAADAHPSPYAHDLAGERIARTVLERFDGEPGRVRE
ncbi:MAG: SGNH/GDSL hydrolase family protein [Candidatus Eisenbacteria bacterium]|nr:SGNH/GDSL hydrolase family protein [Candidatus Eisenbacteria bacterium]